MTINSEDLRLYAITDRSWINACEKLEDKVREAIEAGVTCIQLREKELKGDDLLNLALAIKEVCAQYKIPYIINDDPNLAKEIDADGVHVGLSDARVSQARKILGPDKIVGATAKTVDQAKKAQSEGADYLGSGAVFGSTTKKDAVYMTKELLNEIVASVDIPVVAIGGINRDNVKELEGSSIAGIAVISGIFKGNIRDNTLALKAWVNQNLDN